MCLHLLTCFSIPLVSEISSSMWAGFVELVNEQVIELVNMGPLCHDVVLSAIDAV